VADAVRLNQRRSEKWREKNVGRDHVGSEKALIAVIQQAWIGGVGHEIGMPIFDIRVESTKPKDLAPDLRQITATITAAIIATTNSMSTKPSLAVVRLREMREIGNTSGLLAYRRPSYLIFRDP